MKTISRANVIRSLFCFAVLGIVSACVSTPTPLPTTVPAPTSAPTIVSPTDMLAPTQSFTATSQLTNTVAPTFTTLPPTATNLPATATSTLIPFTATHLPPTNTRIPKTPTSASTPPSPTRAPTILPTQPPSPLPPTQAPPPPSAFQATQLMNIPEGIVRLGSPGGQGHPADQLPQHDVRLGAFAIEQHEVTNAQYDACVRAGACSPAGEKLNGDTFPRVNVTWHQANAYCTWIGRRLPNEAEWERAAKGEDNWEYSWSNRPAPHFEWNAQFHGSPLSFCEASCPVPHYINDVNDGFATTAPVGAFGQILSTNVRQDISKGFNVLDTNGNVSEWVSNWYDGGAYQQGYPTNVFGPANGSHKVYRGGSWATEPLRLATRFSLPPDQRKNDLGFRCAQ